MDVGDVCTPLLVDRICAKITLEYVFLIIRHGTLVRMMVIFLYNNRTQTLPCHMALDTLQAARDTVPVQDAPDFHRPIALFGFVKYLFYPAAEFLLRFLSV